MAILSRAFASFDVTQRDLPMCTSKLLLVLLTAVLGFAYLIKVNKFLQVK